LAACRSAGTLDGALRLRLLPVARQQALLDLLLDVLGEAPAHQLGRHLALAEAGQADALAVLLNHPLRLRLHGRRRHLDLELLAAGTDVFQG
jgi:hypothetical protein